ncbi:hypothetical protein [Kluyvera georgiana]|uniref:hypothetical protein n=1 Tax=Kluyvera georgiana TaxID=73098 RepID=UPI0008071995|nr:hypothetical protein [Kluyvera georgiana]
MITPKDLIEQAQSVKDFWTLYSENSVDSGGVLILVILVFVILIKLPIKNMFEFLDYVGDKKINKYKKYIEVGEKVLGNTEMLMLKEECSSLIIKNITGFKNKAKQYVYTKISIKHSDAIPPINIRRLVRNTDVTLGSVPTLHWSFVLANVLILILSWVFYLLAIVAVGLSFYLYYWVYPEISIEFCVITVVLIAAGFIYQKIYVPKNELELYTSSLAQIVIPGDLGS